jgi:ribosomal protein S18 acetylase RimI-like enzyme
VSAARDATLRDAIGADGPAIAELHVRAWQAAYAGILPAARLAALAADLPRRRIQRTEWIHAAPGEGKRHVVLEEGGRLVGWACFGPPRDQDLGAEALELYAIYLEPDAIGNGHGRRLMEAFLGDARGRGCTEAVMWVLEANERALRFYARAGFRTDERRAAEPFEDTGVAKRRLRRALLGDPGDRVEP